MPKEQSTEPRDMVENYTNAFLVSATVLCLMILLAIWAIWGFVAACLIGWVTDRALVLESRRARVDRT